MNTKVSENFDAIKFDIQLTRAETALLRQDSENFENQQESILEAIQELPLTLTQVLANKAVLPKVKTHNLWKDADFEQLEWARKELRLLMRHRTSQMFEIEKLNLSDLVLVRDNVEFGPEMERSTTAEYRKKVEEKIKDLLSKNEVLKKLKNGQSISDYDILALADSLRAEDPYITESLLQKVYDNRTARFIDFIRHILGLQKLENESDPSYNSF